MWKGKASAMVLTSLFTALTAVLSYLILPLPLSPVPVTGQTLGVMLSGLLLPPREAFLSQVLYILLGIAGLPVFAAGTSGLGILLGPTGGFILSFPLGAYIISRLSSGSQKPVVRGLGLVAGGMFAIYLPGLLQFAWITGAHPLAAVVTVVLPFLPGDLLKGIIALMAQTKIRRILYPNGE